MKLRVSLSARSLLCASFAFAAGLTSGANAQVATSANYQLDGYGFANTGGGTCAPGVVAYTSLGGISGGSFGSLNFIAGDGFLEQFDPDLPTSLVVFGVTPNYGPKVGGTQVTVSGFNFDKLGAGPSTFVSVGGVPATGVTVVSNTELKFTTPPGLAGPRLLAIANTYGAVIKSDGFIYAPAVISSPTVMLGGNLDITNYGNPGDTYTTFVSTSTCVIPAAPYGTLLIGPFPFIQLLPFLPYGGTGASLVSLPVPVLPALSGITVHFQSVSLFASGGPPPGALTNASTTSIL